MRTAGCKCRQQRRGWSASQPRTRASDGSRIGAQTPFAKLICEIHTIRHRANGPWCAPMCAPVAGRTLDLPSERAWPTDRVSESREEAEALPGVKEQVASERPASRPNLWILRLPGDSTAAK